MSSQIDEPNTRAASLPLNTRRALNRQVSACIRKKGDTIFLPLQEQGVFAMSNKSVSFSLRLVYEQISTEAGTTTDYEVKIQSTAATGHPRRTHSIIIDHQIRWTTGNGWCICLPLPVNPLVCDVMQQGIYVFGCRLCPQVRKSMQTARKRPLRSVRLDRLLPLCRSPRTARLSRRSSQNVRTNFFGVPHTLGFFEHLVKLTLIRDGDG